MKPKLKQQDKKDENLKQQRWIGKIKENKEIFIVTGLVVLLSIIVWLSKITDLPYHFFGAQPTPVNWQEALVLTILIIFIGIIVITIIRNFVNERKKSKKVLQKSEAKYRTLYENMPGAYYRTDKDGNLIMINLEGAKLFGYNSLKDILEKNISQDLYFAPEDRKKYLKELEKNKGSLKDFELNLKKKDGTPLVISDTSHYYYDKEGNIAGVEGIFVDITERKRSEKFQQVLYNISKATNSPISLEQLYPIIHKELGSIIDTTNFYIALVDEKKDKIYFPFHIDEKDDNFPISNFSTSNSITTYVIKTGQSLLSDNNQYKEMISKGILSPMGSTTDESIWLGVPLKIEDKVIGAMAVQSYTNPELYSKGDIKIMEFVSEQVATAIERKRAEEDLRNSQQEFASLFRSTPEALVYLDKNSNILNINPRFTELFGYSLEEVKGRNLDDGMIHPPDKIEEGKWLTKKSLEGHFYFETIRKKKDGTLFPVAISGSQVIIDGQLKGLIGIFQDITERKKMEQELKKLAHYDVLTGCCSRGRGLALLEQQIKTANRKKTPVLLFYLDIDDFKHINDTFGHQEGDKVLKEAAKLFKSTLREVDNVCRIGGDEFLLIFPESSLNDAPLIRERLNTNLGKLNQKLAKPYKIDFSIGLSYYDPAHPLSIDELIRIADENMYEEKK
ncbi:MAG TPA: hypothetical protein DCK79_11050 [Candidatus Atribacteria bacterium]|jgi:diguanylate cyclase (GGDEF)-like protein/PAS domain S-box-containing protein|nr:hypothetical protein [Candidatus Atribacteria bacterium]